MSIEKQLQQVDALEIEDLLDVKKKKTDERTPSLYLFQTNM